MDKQTCQNCKYFRRYYVLSASLTFTSTNKGFFSHIDNVTGAASKHIKNNYTCFLWQPYELEKIEQQYKMEILLKNIETKIENILALLRLIE